MPTMKLTGLDTPAHTPRTPARPRRPGANSTPAPAFPNANSRPTPTPRAAVAPTEDAGRGGARCRQRLEAEPREDARRAGVPRVGNHEDAGRLMQRAKTGGLVALACRHEVPPRPRIPWPTVASRRPGARASVARPARSGRGDPAGAG